MSELTEWSEAELTTNATVNRRLLVVFPRLEYLKVDDCMRLVCAPSHFPCLKELEISHVHSGLPLASICGIKLTSLTQLQISLIDGLTCLPTWLFCNNQNLSRLVIWRCHNLMRLVPRLEGGGTALRELCISRCSKLGELPYDLHSLSALEILSIADCPKLKTIPRNEELLGFISLRVLSITRCTGLTNLTGEMIESCAPSLEKLKLRELTSLRMNNNIGMVIGSLHKMSRLSELIIDDVSMTMTTRLRHLRASTCSDYSMLVVDAILKSSTKASLCRLDLYGTQHSRDLSDQLQHLTAAVSKLELYGFREIEELPEWFGNNLSSSLHKLYLSNCKKLRYLPSKKAMLRLTKLTHLEIYKCPLLDVMDRRDGGDDDDSEWRKISHIPNIRVNGAVITTNAH